MWEGPAVQCGGGGEDWETGVEVTGQAGPAAETWQRKDHLQGPAAAVAASSWEIWGKKNNRS